MQNETRRGLWVSLIQLTLYTSEIEKKIHLFSFHVKLQIRSNLLSIFLKQNQVLVTYPAAFNELESLYI